MYVSAGNDALPDELKGSVLAIGNFDGVHRGHQSVLTRTRSIAADLRAPAGVLLFDPHPRVFFAPERPHFTLTPLPEKLRLLASLELDLAVVLAFDRTLSAMSAESFVASVLVERLEVRHVVVGYDFQFGHGRHGNPDLLRSSGARFGFGVTVIEPVSDPREVYSSSRVRRLLREGDVASAAAVLGHNWRLVGTVAGGAKRGTGLGFPTANVRLAGGQDLKHGIYAARVHLATGKHDAAAYLGTRPTFDDGMPVLEVFLFDFDGNLYGREIAVELVDYLRGDEAFPSVDALKAQMAIDCSRARASLRADERGRVSD